MSKRRVSIGLLTALVLSACAGGALAATRTTTIYVTGMTCGGCAISIEQALNKTEGVEDVRVSYERGEAVVKYDDRKVTAAKLREVVKGIGFRAMARPAKRGSKTAKPKASACCDEVSCDTQPLS
jgi:mercuric transport protein